MPSFAVIRLWQQADEAIPPSLTVRDRLRKVFTRNDGDHESWKINKAQPVVKKNVPRIPPPIDREEIPQPVQRREEIRRPVQGQIENYGAFRYREDRDGNSHTIVVEYQPARPRGRETNFSLFSCPSRRY